VTSSMTGIVVLMWVIGFLRQTLGINLVMQVIEEISQPGLSLNMKSAILKDTFYMKRNEQLSS